MQAQDGTLVGLNKKQFSELMDHGNQNLVAVGDVFRISKCYFQVETIREHGISAKGISRREYYENKKRIRL